MSFQKVGLSMPFAIAIHVNPRGNRYIIVLKLEKIFIL